MKDRVVEILMILMSEMRNDKQLGDIDISSLTSKGYTQSEISDAFTWLYESFQGLDPPTTSFSEGHRDSRRVFHEAEKMVFATEAQGYMILLREVGLLDDRDVEAVIERAMVTGYERLSVGEVRQIVAAVLAGKRRSGPGSDPMLPGGGDTVH